MGAHGRGPRGGPACAAAPAPDDARTQQDAAAHGASPRECCNHCCFQNMGEKVGQGEQNMRQRPDSCKGWPPPFAGAACLPSAPSAHVGRCLWLQQTPASPPTKLTQGRAPHFRPLGRQSGLAHWAARRPGSSPRSRTARTRGGAAAAAPLHYSSATHISSPQPRWRSLNDGGEALVALCKRAAAGPGRGALSWIFLSPGFWDLEEDVIGLTCPVPSLTQPVWFRLIGGWVG